MKRIVIAIGGNYPDQHKKSVYLNSIEKIFTEMGKMIAENDVVIIYSGSCNENKPSPTAIMNSYDHVKYTYAYRLKNYRGDFWRFFSIESENSHFAG